MNAPKNVNNNNTLWVCWEEPEHMPTHDFVVLSFLKPGIEAQLKNKCVKQDFICARERATSVKQRALDAYIQMVSHIGIVDKEDGVTFRQDLQGCEEVCPWWLHPTSRKYCEGDPTFDRIIQILIIQQVAQEFGCSDIIMYGGSDDVVRVLQKQFTVSAESPHKRNVLWAYTVLPLLKRVKFLLVSLYELAQLHRCGLTPCERKFDVLFSGSWDWSVCEDSSTKKLVDRYYQAIPEKLKANELKIGWLAWFQHKADPNKSPRTIREVARPLKDHPEVIIAQCFIGYWDVIKTVFNFRPWFVYMGIKNRRGFRKVFDREGFNFFPVFAEVLFSGFLDSTIPQYTLVFHAHKRAARKYRPTNVVSFLDFFLYARAVNAGVRQGSRRTTLYNVQHASYSREKTFGIIEPSIEYKGRPDGYAMPTPDYVFAMGELGREIFLEAGFSPDQVFATGSSRYDKASTFDIHTPPRQVSGKNILIASTLQKQGLEFEMIDCVYAALCDTPGVSVSLRSHPFFNIDQQPEFDKYRDKIRCTSGTTLAQDFAQADIVLFTYSTVAEEAFIQGIPVWQWVSTGYNGSVFRDIGVIPTFSSVEDLKQLHEHFLQDPAKFMPTYEQRKLVKAQCFYGEDNGVPSDNIARILTRQFSKRDDLVLTGEHQEIR